MKAGTFWLKLSAFLVPLLAVYSVPLAVMVPSGEVLSPDHIAAAHARAAPDVLYGPAYTNPDRRYKLVSLLLRDVPVVAVGSSRVMNFRSELFRGGDETFYNAGGIVGVVFHLRRLLAHLPMSSRSRQLVVGLDQWWFTDANLASRDDPQVEGYYTEQSDTLANLRFGLSAWPDVLDGKVSLPVLLRGTKNWGVNAAMLGNGWRRDGSYLYTSTLKNPSAAVDYQFKGTLERVRDRRNGFEPGDVASENALAETRRFALACRDRGITVAFLLPPFAPTVERALRATQHHRYVDGLGERVEHALDGTGATVHDFTSCEPLGCTDSEFVDGAHGGDTVYARLLARMADDVPWLAAAAEPSLGERVKRGEGTPTWEPP